MKRRVVITGAGCITPLGNSPQSLWENLIAGRSGVGPIRLFDASSFPVRIAAEVPDWDMAQVSRDLEVAGHWARQTQFAAVAAREAVRSSGLRDSAPSPERIGICTGCGEIYPDFQGWCHSGAAATGDQGFDLQEFLQQSRQSMPADQDLFLEPGLATGLIAAAVHAQGPQMNYTSACVSSTKAIGEAAERIGAGEADVMLAGGAHSMIHPFGLSGFLRLSTLSMRNDEPTRAARPFDRQRDGFVIGEGGAILVLEAREHALRRNAEIWAEFTGWGSTHDAYRITDLEPEGRAAARCMRLALHQARLNPEDIDYINAHGSGTVLNDKTETLAIKRALGDWAYHVPISSTKSMTGHLTTACGAIESLICVMALRHGVAPPTINLRAPDPECDLDYVANAAREIVCRHTMKNSFGFGGQNIVLILSRYEA